TFMWCILSRRYNWTLQKINIKRFRDIIQTDRDTLCSCNLLHHARVQNRQDPSFFFGIDHEGAVVFWWFCDHISSQLATTLHIYMFELATGFNWLAAVYYLHEMMHNDKKGL
ncbi:hypothetical protein ACJX0J_008007, partial [Zea mays]